MLKKSDLLRFCVVGALIAGSGCAQAQFAPVPANQPQAAEALSAPDDVRTGLLIRNALIALNQANLTGNYTVLRDMGTPSFQLTNSSARLAEIFASLRARKLDLSPIMAFNPKLTETPSIQDGQLLKLAGYFPTAPEQVQFDLAFQRYGETWLIAGIAVNIAPPPEGAQAPAASVGQSAQTAFDATPGEAAKPIRIDLNQPAPPAPATKPAAPKKPVAVKKPKPAPKPAAAQTAPAEQPAAAQAPAQGEQPPEKPAEKSTAAEPTWNPFGH